MRFLPVDDLAVLARHVAGGEARCAQQAALIARLRVAGYDTGEDEIILAIQRQSLALLRAHQNIVQAAYEIR